MIVFILTLAAALAALLGGYVAIRSRKQLHAAMALTSGLVLGLVAFDLLRIGLLLLARLMQGAAWEP